ncbi:hypothetical protein, partial [Caballeronia sp. M23-90]
KGKDMKTPSQQEIALGLEAEWIEMLNRSVMKKSVQNIEQLREFEHRGGAVGNRQRQRDETALANVDLGGDGGSKRVSGQIKLWLKNVIAGKAADFVFIEKGAGACPRQANVA